MERTQAKPLSVVIYRLTWTLLGPVSLFLTAISFMMVALIEQRVSGGETLSVLWQTLPYIVLTAGEVLVSNTGLEFAFREAPASMRSTMMSFWLLTTALGNLAIAKVFGLNVKERLADGTEVLHVSGVSFFNLCAGMLAVVAGLKPTDFYKSMTTHADHTIWQDLGCQ